jgi:hypothetical protein
MAFTGLQKGQLTYFVNGHPYQGADNPVDKYIQARPEDVQVLLALGVWQVVPPPSKPTVMPEAQLSSDGDELSFVPEQVAPFAPEAV